MRVQPPVLVALLLAASTASQSEPTPEETATLYWINRFRADPPAFARLVIGEKPANTENVDWQMFLAELGTLPPAPPLVFEPRLLDAARAHARYMIQAQEYGHHETDGRPGFTGAFPTDRARAQGYHDPVEECSFGRGTTPFAIVASYVVDAAPPGQGTGGMQLRRGHRRCLIDPKWREVGVGLIAWGDGLHSNVALFGLAAGVDRVQGGVVFDDRDGDAAYDPGEGLGGVHLALGDLGTVTTSSGAWRLDLPAGSKPKQLVARLGALAIPCALAAGSGNVPCELLLPVQARIADLERQFAALPAAAAAQQRELRVQLLELRPPASADEQPLADEIARLRVAVLAGLGKWSRAEAEQVLAPARRAFAGTALEAWLRHAQAAEPLARDALAALANPGTAAKRTAAATAIERRLATIHSADLWRELARLRAALLAK